MVLWAISLTPQLCPFVGRLTFPRAEQLISVRAAQAVAGKLASLSLPVHIVFDTHHFGRTLPSVNQYFTLLVFIILIYNGKPQAIHTQYTRP